MAKTNSGLLAYAKAQVGLPYWYGTFGQTATEALYQAKKKQYPKYYTASDFARQYGKRIHDCVGLIKGYLWSDSATTTPKYRAEQDVNARGMYAGATTKGTISTFPGKAGLLVFKSGTSAVSGINHVGVYDGAGYVYEAKGHAYGVIKTAFKASVWQFWAQCPYTEADTPATPAPQEKTETQTKKEGYTMTMRNMRKGDQGEDVRALQILLRGRGYNGNMNEKLDGIFGGNTEGAVKLFQKANGLAVDGVVGPATMGCLLGV